MRAAWLALALVVLTAGCLSTDAGEELDPAGNGTAETNASDAEFDDGANGTDEAGGNGTAPANDTDDGADGAGGNATDDARNRSAPEDAAPDDPEIRRLWEQARNGTVEVQAGGEAFTLDVAPHALVAEDAFVETDRSPVEAPWTGTFEGQVEGAPDSEVRLLFAEDWLGGVVYQGTATYLVGHDGNAWATLDHATGAASPFATANGGVPTFSPDRVDQTDVACLHPAPTPASPVLPVDDPDPITVDVIVDTDPSVAETYDEDPKRLGLLWISMVDAIYEDELGLRLNVVGLHTATEGHGYGDEDPLEELADRWNQRDEPRDLVHLFTARNLGYAQANCIGGAGHPEIAYTFTEMTWAPRNHLMAVAHELGHIFSAHHHYANCAESRVLCTTMINSASLSVKNVFSSVNKAAIRGWAEEHVAG